MVGLMMQFAAYLKFNGIPVSTSSLHNAISTLGWLDLLDRQQVFFGLESCLVHFEKDRDKFLQVFNRFFQEKKPIEFEREDTAFRLQVEEFTGHMREDGDYLNHILADYIEGDAIELLQNIGDDPKFRMVKDEAGVGVSMSKQKVRKEILQRIKLLLDQVEDFAAASFHMTREKRAKLSEFLSEHLKEAASLIEQKPFHKQARRHLMPWEKQRTLSTISFDKLSLDEQEKVKDEVEKIAQKLKDALSRQKKKAHIGHIDIKNTMRHSMKYGGVPFKIKMKEPSKKKGKIVALCDISMSVSYAAQFMLLLLYRLQNRFSKIRSFVFIRNSYEISHFFTKYPLEKALQKAIKQHNIGMGQLTNYGMAFKSFLDNYSSALTKDTTVLILGDGLNNHNDPRPDYLEEITKKVARSIWLNPEEEEYWYSPSNAMNSYIPICTQVVECATLDQLADFTKNLVL